MKHSSRKYYHILGIIICLPLITAVLTDHSLTTLVREWSVNLGISSRLIMTIHIGEIIHLQGVYSILNGLGLVGLVITGLSLSSGVFHNKVKRGNSSPYYHLVEGQFTAVILVVRIKNFLIN